VSSAAQRRFRFHVQRERDSYTRALSLVVSRGFGCHVRLTLWWWSISWHRRDRELERRLHAEIDVLEAARLNREEAHQGGALDV
jgi:hypothetical protein